MPAIFSLQFGRPLRIIRCKNERLFFQKDIFVKCKKWGLFLLKITLTFKGTISEFDVDQNEFGADTAGKKDSNSTENEIISVEEGLGMSENKPKLKKIYARSKQKHFSLAKSNNQCIETQATSNYNVNLTVQEEKINLDYNEHVVENTSFTCFFLFVHRSLFFLIIKSKRL